MPNYEANGKIIEIFQTQQVSEKFSKREFVLTIPDGNYPQDVKFQFTQDKCSILDQYKVGEEVKVAFNLQGKAFSKNGTTNYFNNLGVWKIEKVGSSSGNGTPPSGSTGGSHYTIQPEESSDLPF